MIPRHPSNRPQFKLKRRQREDYARMALTPNGGVLGHDTGCGKGLALFVIPALRTGFVWPGQQGSSSSSSSSSIPTSLQPLAPVLLVVPGDLHDQVMEEGREKFRAKVTRLDSQETFLKLSQPNPLTGRRELPAGYYITSYTELTSNDVTPFPKWDYLNLAGIMDQLGLTERDVERFFNARAIYFKEHFDRLRITADVTLRDLEAAFKIALGEYAVEQFKREITAAYQRLRIFWPVGQGLNCRPSFAGLSPENLKAVRDYMVRFRYDEYKQAIGDSRWQKRSRAKAGNTPSLAGAGEGRGEGQGEKPFTPGRGSAPADDFKIKCVYSPSLADLCQDSFAAVAVDEGVKMKGEDTIVGTGIRQMNPGFRLVLTATPIKNRLPDVFRLAWWAAGARPEAHARFPYPDATAAREQFAHEFLVSERNLTKEQLSETNRRFLKLTPQVCNVHRLWKIMAPVILRRRKKDFGEDLVQKIRQPVRVPMGKEQAAVYRFHIEAEYKDINGRPAIGAQLQALRIASANPASTLLVRPAGDKATEGDPRSKLGYIPKLHAALKLVHQILARGEQVVIFSAFHDSLDVLSARLEAAGVRHCVLDGRVSQKKRALHAKNFKQGPGRADCPVMLAGIECMAQGHSFNLCNNVILMCYSWAYDAWEQAINRVHRLNSLKDVNVYPILCEGSIDLRLEAQTNEKGGAAELVLDGSLQDENITEVNLAELLDIARKEFTKNGKAVIDEKKLELEWPGLRSSLAVAASLWVSTARENNRPDKTVEIAAESAPAGLTEVAIPKIRPPKSIDVLLPPIAFEDMPLWRQRITA